MPAADLALDEDLRTGIADAEYKVGFEDLRAARPPDWETSAGGVVGIRLIEHARRTGNAPRLDELARTLGISQLRQPLSAPVTRHLANLCA
jgi:hypothetical protein